MARCSCRTQQDEDRRLRTPFWIYRHSIRFLAVASSGRAEYAKSAILKDRRQLSCVSSSFRSMTALLQLLNAFDMSLSALTFDVLSASACCTLVQIRCTTALRHLWCGASSVGPLSHPMMHFRRQPHRRSDRTSPTSWDATPPSVWRSNQPTGHRVALLRQASWVVDIFEQAMNACSTVCRLR